MTGRPKSEDAFTYNLDPRAKELADAVVKWREDHRGNFPKASELIQIIKELGWRYTAPWQR